jgi:hypothetical protein
MTDRGDRQEQAGTPARPTGPYWDDPVFRFISRQRRSTGDEAAECERLDALMQDLMNGAMSDEAYWELAAEAKADQTKRKQDRKQRQIRPPAGVGSAEQRSSRNIRDLRKRIFNRHVSRENVIKALEALPPRERAATIAGLPPGLKRKLGKYLKG